MKHIPAAMIFVGLMLMAVVAFGQDGHHGQGHAQHHDWYRELKQPGTGFSCCNALTPENPSGDCRPTRAYRDDDGVWWALIDGTWHSVPPRVVLDAELNLEPFQAHVCASKSGLIYCFLGKRAGG